VIGGTTIRTDRLTIEGKSRAGNETWFKVRELGVVLDIGRCPDTVVGTANVFITHAHLDHALGIPFYAAQRRLYRLAAGTVHVPRENVDDYRALMALHEKLEGTQYPLNLVGMEPGDVVRLRRDLRVRAHRSTHRVVANAYEFLEVRKKLRHEFAGSSEDEIIAMRSNGPDPFEESLHSLLLYTGDTDRRIFAQTDAVYRAEVLMIECSFTGEDDAARAERFTHIHIDDIFERADLFENHVIILTHFSLRDSPEEIRSKIAARCPARLRDRIRLTLPEPHGRL
jgi:ribonuclease Z